jgi:hypothetical protein
MPKVTHSSRPRIVSRHLDPPTVDPPTVEPVNARAVKAHYVGRGAFTLLQWAPAMLLCVIVLTAAAAFIWTRQALIYADVGRALCERPLMVPPEYRCDLSALECMTHPEVSVVLQLDEQLRAHNLWQAERCVRAL